MNSSYQIQFDKKLERLKELLAPFSNVEPGAYQSPESGYRQRVEFRVWHEGELASYAMFKPGSKELYCLDSFDPAAPAIAKLMPGLMSYLNQTAELKKRLFSIEFLSTLSGEILVTLIYHRPLDENWAEIAKQLEQEFSIWVIGRSRKQKLCLTQDYVTEELEIAENKYRFQQIEGSFTQPNALVNREMISWARALLGKQQSDLLELYCGNGNFTIPLASRFQKVFATEISKSSIRALNWNIEANQITNLNCARLSAEEMGDALKGVRPFRRLADIDLASYNFSHILVDPPRAGLDAKTLDFVQGFEYILYISCNPQSLADNLEQLSQSHTIVSAALFDQFPFTPHMESGVYLKKIAEQN